MRPVTGGRIPEPAAEPCPDLPDHACRWCGEALAWVWSVGGDGPVDLDRWLAQDEVGVCSTCQALTLAGDDAALLDRFTMVMTAHVTYPVALDFLREQRAAWLAHWVLRRTTVRPAAEHAAGAVR
jgi:hypothetical protein